MITLTILFVAFLTGIGWLWTARRAALAVGLVDRPDARKRHLGDVPLAGGTGIYAALVTTALIAWPLAPYGESGVAAIALGLLALALGMVDDARGLPPKLRLLLQAGLALLLATVFGIGIDGLGNVFGTGDVAFGAVGSIVFTAFCIAGALNATNMIDGLDGLLASLVGLSLAALTILTIQAGNPPEPLGIAAIGALGAFLVFNLGAFGPTRRLFLGDSGSTLLGLLLAVLIIGAAQGSRPSIEPVTAGWLLGLPLLDTTAVVARRLLEGRSPLVAGRDHLHHLLQDLGLSPRRTLVTMIALHVSLLGIGFIADLSGAPAWMFLYGFVALTFVHFGASVAMTRRLDARSEPPATDVGAETVATSWPAIPSSRPIASGPLEPSASVPRQPTPIGPGPVRAIVRPAPSPSRRGAREAELTD